MKKNYDHIIQGLKNKERESQKELFSSYGPLFLSIVRRYVKIQEDAEDVYLEGFFKIFTKINTYTGKGNFEGWMKRIMVNEALMFLRKNRNFNISIENSNIDIKYETHFDSDIDYKALLKLLDLLPIGYRTVFNLYVIEGYKHREIAEELSISINTSKSQLILAKKRLKEIIKKKQKYNIA